MERYYVYTHKRNDTQEIFYVGKGKVSKRASGKVDTYTFNRAYTKHVANRYWINITNTISYSVDIIEDYLTFEQAEERETYWIKYYGRKDKGEGLLVNFTDGGGGSRNFIVSDKARETQRQRMSGPDNPTKKPDNKARQSQRMKENNPMKRGDTAKRVAAIKLEKYKTGELIHPLKGKKRPDLAERNKLRAKNKGTEAPSLN